MNQYKVKRSFTIVENVFKVSFDRVRRPIDELAPQMIEYQIAHQISSGRFRSDWRQAVTSPLAYVQTLVVLKQVLFFLIVIGKQLFVRAVLFNDFLLQVGELVFFVDQFVLAHLSNGHVRSVQIQAWQITVKMR